MTGTAIQPSATRKRYLKPSLLWSIRQDLPVGLSLLMPLIGFAVPLLVWMLLSASGWVSPTFLPSPLAVLQAGGQMLTEEDLWRDIGFSAMRVLAGFLMAAIVGVPLGILTGTFRSMEGLFSPLVGMVRYMPVVAFVPLIVIWVGLGEEAKATIIFLGIVLYNTMMVADAVKFIPDEMLNVAYTLGATRREVLCNVVLPAVTPSILDTLRVNIAGAWNFLVVSELLAAQVGLGFKILQSQRYLQTDKVLFCILVIGLIGLLTDLFLKRLALALTPWAEHHR